MSSKPFVILFVEDNDLVREATADDLVRAERRLVCVADGAGARKALREQPVHLLITDINLPDGSGLDVAREALQLNPGMPVIVCSGDHVKDVSQSLGRSAHLLQKPFNFDELEALVDKLAGL